MFQTEPVKFLQSLETGWLTDFLVLVSRLGSTEFYIAALILITFGVSFRTGFLLTQMMLWVGIATDLLKNGFALPRPADVDSAVKLLAETDPTNPTPFIGQGGAGFWELPDAETIRLIRVDHEGSFGLPSGHVAGTTVFWGGLWLVYRRVPLGVAAVAMVCLMPLSRMYLGRHFLADVLGGLVLGAAFLAVTRALSGGIGTATRLTPRAGPVAAMLLVPLVLLGLEPLVEPRVAGHLLGLNLAFVLLLGTSGLPTDRGSGMRRAGRVLLALAIYVSTGWFVGRSFAMTSLSSEASWIAFSAATIPTFAALWGGVRIGCALGLYTADER